MHGGLPDGESFPLLLPFQYAMAASQARPPNTLSNTVYLNDLEVIQSEVGQPLVLIIDEFDSVAHNLVVLQKFRNIFTRAEKYMIVLSGTDTMLENLDRVFAPMGRQFKTIGVGPFMDVNDTEDCILAPLKRLGLNPRTLIAPETYGSLSELHELARGRPYEINLLCHLMFSRVQQGLASQMTLNLAVLEQVRRQLEREQDVNLRPVLSAVRNMSVESLRALAVLVDSGGTATFEQTWDVEFVFRGTTRYSKESLKKWLQTFADQSILDIDEGRIRFVGDEFDRLYVTYLAQEQRVHLSFPTATGLTVEAYWIGRLRAWLVSRFAMALGPTRTGESREDLDRSTLHDLLSILGGFKTDGAFLDRHRRLVLDLHYLLTQAQGRSNIPILRMRLRVGRVDFSVLHVSPRLINDEIGDRFEADLHGVKDRLAAIGGTLDIDLDEFPVCRLDLMIDSVSAVASESLRRDLARRHVQVARHLYDEDGGAEVALRHAHIAFAYGADVWTYSMNDLGYIFLSNGNLVGARTMLHRALSASDGDTSLEPLIRYNLAVANTEMGEIDAALDQLAKTIGLLEGVDEEDRRMAYLICVVSQPGPISFKEARAPDLLVAAFELRRALQP
jgi:hypothetical protein